jgi:predicted metalloprotease
MTFDDQRVDTGGVDDRRGRSRAGGLAVGGGGLGLVGLLLVVLLNALGGGEGIDPTQFTNDSVQTQGAGESTAELEARCNTAGGIEQYNDCYMIKSYNEINEVWTAELRRRGLEYRQPRLVFFEQATQTGCGTASSQVGPFYCPADQAVFFDLGFLVALQQKFGADGRYAQTYIIAHEVGHHLQSLFGTEARIGDAQRGASEARQRELSIAMELQADCYAGVWSTLANKAGNFAITERELDQALNAAAAVGDDRIQQKVQGRVDPESWTHGSAQQRRSAFLTGYQTADIERCPAVG